MKKIVSALALMVLSLNSIKAQNQEEVTIKALITEMFDAMRVGDSARMHRTFHPEMSLKTVVVDKEGAVRLKTENIQDFLKSVGTPKEVILDERILDWEIRIDGNLATVWTPYSFYISDRFSHCGVNAFQLIKQNQRWMIFHIADTRRREACQN